MSNPDTFLDQPELVFGIAAAIGVDVAQVAESLTAALSSVSYNSEIIKLTNEMLSYPLQNELPQAGNYYELMNYKMDYGNALCREFGDPSTLARIGVRAIQKRRQKITGDRKKAALSTAYIVHQLKRRDEVELLRRVYGPRFMLISAYGAEPQRKDRLEKQLRRTMSTKQTGADITCAAERLIERDASESKDALGQRLQDTFPLADLFVDGFGKSNLDQMMKRFINALFGRTDISPSKAEYGMYAAKSASLRSADLSRQVGAAIFSDDGELITQGCNEAPKAFGGTYWDSEEPDYRDVKIGYDPNEVFKKELIRDLLERLDEDGFLSEKAAAIGNPSKLVERLTRTPKDPHKKIGAFVGSAVLDVTEFGRIVHAEMCAICDAARLGKSIKGATLYCTTFPCHNCTKHVLAAGIKRVVYIEPYPKSKAKELHENEIEIEKIVPGRVSYMPFIGISPHIYRDIFEKGKRKGADGLARTWYSGVPRPQINAAAPSYFEVESLAVSNTLLGKLTDGVQDTTTPASGAEEAPAKE